jgi:hypothetical protein
MTFTLLVMGLLVRVAAGAAAAALLTVPATAWANSDAAIDDGTVPATAAEADQLCEAAFGGGPYPGEDVWVFVLPDNRAGRDFIGITASFSTGPGLAVDEIVSASDPGGGIADDGGTSKGWIVTPSGWTLLTATALVTGRPAIVTFTLSHTCPGAGEPSPSPRSMPTPAPAGTRIVEAIPSTPGFPKPSTTPLGDVPVPTRTPISTPMATAVPLAQEWPPTGEESMPPSSESPGKTAGPAPSFGPETGGGAASGAGRILLGGGSLLAGAAGAGVLLVMARRRRGLA